MDRELLIKFAYWLLDGEFGEGHEVELVDKFIADQGEGGT